MLLIDMIVGSKFLVIACASRMPTQNAMDWRSTAEPSSIFEWVIYAGRQNLHGIWRRARRNAPGPHRGRALESDQQRYSTSQANFTNR
jgi:hypothetical protein